MSQRQPEPQSLDSTRAESAPQSTSNVSAATLPPQAPAASATATPIETERYHFGEEIAHGGMGVIFRGQDKLLGRPLAFKVLRSHLAASTDMVQRFLAEAQITGQLQHPGVVPLHEIGQLPDGRPFFAMKLIEGRTLQALLDERAGPEQDLPRFLKIFEQICETVAYAHARGVIHRDLKPGNVMVGAFGEVQVMDWGLAKKMTPGPGPSPAESTGPEPSPGLLPASGDSDAQTEWGSVLGTIAYMAPEQARGHTAWISARSDVFGLGAVLCKILTAQPPYTGSREAMRAAARAGATAAALENLRTCGAEADLVRLAETCLEQDPQRRPADAGAVARAVAAYLAGVQKRLRTAELERAAAQARALEERRSRQVALILSAAVLLLGLFGGTAAWWWQHERETRAAEARLRDAVAVRDCTAAIDEARQLHDAGLQQADDPERWHLTLTAARSALKHSDSATAALGGEALVAAFNNIERILEEAERDCQLLRDLDRIWLTKTEVKEGKFLFEAAVPQYTAAFKRWGLDVANTAPAAAGQRLRVHRFRERLLAALGDWARWETPDKRQHLDRVLDAADPDPGAFRQLWRKAVRQGDREALKRLAKSGEVDKLAPLTLLTLAADLSKLVSVEAAVKLLRAGLELHRGDFWLNYEASREMRLLEPPDLDGAIRCATVAVALRGRSPATHLLLGNAYLACEDLASAIHCYRTALELDPQAPVVLSNLGVALVGTGDVDEAVRLQQKAVFIDPINPLFRYNLGAAWRAKGNLRAATHALLLAVQMDPLHAAGHAMLANLLQGRGDLAGARDSLKKAVALQPQTARYQLHLGNILFELNDLEGARHCYEAATRLAPQDALGYFNLGNVLYHLHEYDQAAAHLEKALKISPEMARCHHMLGRVRAAQGNTLAAAQCYETAIAFDPAFVKAREDLARTFIGLRNYDAAIAQYQVLAGLLPDQAWPYNNLGKTYLIKKEFAQAKKSLEQALERDPHFGQAYVNMGDLLKAQKDPAGALQAYEKGVELDPKIAHGHFQLGLLYYGRKDHARAARAFARAAELEPKNARAYYNLGVTQLALGDADSAELSFQKTLDLEPNNALAQHNLGSTFYQRFQYETALGHFQRAAALNPKDAVALNNIGNVLKARGDLDGAQASYEKGLELQPKNLQILTNLGITFQERGAYDQAMTCYEKVLAIDPRFALAHFNRGVLLAKKYDFAGALQAMQQALDVAVGDTAAMQSQLKHVQHMADLAPRLPAILKKEKLPASPLERAEFATLCSVYKGLPFTALKMFNEAFAQEPKLPEALAAGHRFHAACAAAQVGCGLAEDAATLDDAERARWRKQALAWLREDLWLLGKLVPVRSVAERKRMVETLSLWRRNLALAGVRTSAALGNLPEEERAAWQQFWHDVAALARKAEER